MKKLIQSAFKVLGYDLRRSPMPYSLRNRDIPDKDAYQPLFCPWLAPGPFQEYYALAKGRSLVSADRCHVLYTLASQALNGTGDYWECGVYKGGTAAMFASILKKARSNKKLFLFDTFEGMPETDAAKDTHLAGDFADTSLESVKAYVDGGAHCEYRKGFIPSTFAGLESSQISFAHVDVDLHKSIIDCLEFIWPRMTLGGFVVFDDYGFPSCPGARKAVDEFFAGGKCRPLCLSTGQAVVFKGF